MSKIPAIVMFTAVSVACRLSGGMELLTNPDLEVPNAPPGWSLVEIGGNPPSPREAAVQIDFADFDGGGLGLWMEGFQGLYFGNGAEPVTGILSQTVSGTAGENYTFTGHSFFDPFYSGGVDFLEPDAPAGPVASPTQSLFELAFLNAGGAVIGTPTALDLRTEQVNGGGWVQHTLNGVAPAGTASVRVTASAIDMVPNIGAMSAFYDTFTLRGASSPTTELLANADLTTAPDPIAPGWTATGPHAYQGFSAHSGSSGFWLTAYDANPEPLDASLLQTVPATAGTTYQFSGWSYFELGFSGGLETLDPSSPYGEVPSLTETFFVMEFLDGSGAQIGSETRDLRTEQMNDTTWREHVLTALAPAGTTQVRVGVRVDDLMTNVDIPFQSANFDDFSLIAVVDGDFDGNGIVDGNDVLVWQRGESPNPNSAGDLATWRSAYGSGYATPTVGAVPEPTGLAAMLVGLACLATRRRVG